MMMARRIQWSVFLLVLLLLMVKTSVWAAESEVGARTITVSATAEIEILPDEASIVIGFSNTSKLMNEAHTITQKRVEAFSATLIKLGFSKSMINYGNILYQPNFIQVKGAFSKLENFSASQALILKLKDFSLIPILIQAAVDGGATNIGEVRFYSTKLSEFKVQLREEAILAAKKKVKQLAEGFGTNLKEVKTINEQMYSSSVSNYSIANSPPPTNFVQSDNSNGQIGTAVTPNTLFLSLTLEVVYFIE